MANNENIDLGRRFFTNTYVTGSGRHNYLRIDELEDPLFTSFTFDIDYVSSPLFYTINNDDYGYPNVEGMSDKIENVLGIMYGDKMGKDEGYDILPALSASILDGNKLGFGLQQNVYMDTPLYGAVEYIYMVDKRNGGTNQNDARFDSNMFNNTGGNPNELNDYKLGSSVKEIINDSDRIWAERNEEMSAQQVDECNKILGYGDPEDSDYIPGDQDVINEHNANKQALDTATKELDVVRASVDGVTGEFTEGELQNKVNEYKKKIDGFDQLKKDIVAWANSILTKYQNRGTSIYTENRCVLKIASYYDINENNKDTYIEKLKKEFGDNFAENMLFSGENSYVSNFNKLYEELFNGFLEKDGSIANIKKQNVISKFSDKLKQYGLIKDGSNTFEGDIKVYESITPPDWAMIFNSHISYFSENADNYSNVDERIKSIMSYQCDFESSFDKEFTPVDIQNAENMKGKYEVALDNIRSELYGCDETGEVCDRNNPSPDSKYGKYLEAKEIYENDDYSQAEKARALAQSEQITMNDMLSTYYDNQNLMDNNYNDAIQNGIQPYEVNRNKSVVVSQTVLDMLGFIKGMKNMTINYPYIIQGITGLDTAYNKNYGIKDPYLGSGEDKITLTCLESLDLRVSSMFNRYFNAVYDRQYRRERVPVNLRRFNCSIYVHDVRNFVARMRLNEKGEFRTTYNRLLELTDMYYSVIEFRFFDCEIVPEETGNIFNNISNEAPSEMTKTNFTFTYGNCVVNFVPQSEVAAYNAINK